MPPKKKKIGWEKSDAKAALTAALIAKEIPMEEASDEDEDDLKKYFQQRPEVALRGEFRMFKRRLNDLRIELTTSMSRAQTDQIAYDRCVQNHPKHAIAASGNYPEWEGSQAQKQLKIDMENNLHLTMKPMALWGMEGREGIYQLFPLKVFRDHICQAQRTDRCINQLKGNPRKYGNLWKELRDDHDSDDSN